MINTVALIIGYAVLTAVAAAVGAAFLSVSGMLIGMAVTAHARGRVVARRPFRASSSIWAVRHAHFLRAVPLRWHLDRSDRESIQRVGYGTFLWADNFYRRGDDD